MDLQLYEIIVEELRQRKVNTVVSSILIDLCKRQLNQGKSVVQTQESALSTVGRERTVLETVKPVIPSKPAMVSRSVKIEMPRQEVIDTDKDKEVSQDVSEEPDSPDEEIEGGDKLVVSDENLDMMNKMFG